MAPIRAVDPPWDEEVAMILSRAREFERLAEVLARVQRMIESEGGAPARVREALEEAVGLLGVDLDVVRLLDLDTLSGSLVGDPGRLWGVAEVLYVEGVLAVEEGRPEVAEDRLRRARMLYARLEPGLEVPEGMTRPEARRRRIDALLGG